MPRTLCPPPLSKENWAVSPATHLHETRKISYTLARRDKILRPIITATSINPSPKQLLQGLKSIEQLALFALSATPIVDGLSPISLSENPDERRFERAFNQQKKRQDKSLPAEKQELSQEHSHETPPLIRLTSRGLLRFKPLRQPRSKVSAISDDKISCFCLSVIERTKGMHLGAQRTAALSKLKDNVLHNCRIVLRVKKQLQNKKTLFASTIPFYCESICTAIAKSER